MAETAPNLFETNPDAASETGPAYQAQDPATSLYLGDCRQVLPILPEAGTVDLVFADPPFNWDVNYGDWDDSMPREDYEQFTHQWLDACIEVLAPNGSLWVNIPDDSAAEIVLHLKSRGLTMVNWCIWHFRFGQCRNSGFITSKVHALYFCKDPARTGSGIRIRHPRAVRSGRASTAMRERWPRIRTRECVSRWMSGTASTGVGSRGTTRNDEATHQNQIPEVYLERVIESCSNEGSLVLDPFAGSGTTCTVARVAGSSLDLHRIFIRTIAASAWERIHDSRHGAQG